MSKSLDAVSAGRAAGRIVLLALILCAFALRVYKLESQSLWYDEGVSAIVAQYDLASLTQWTADDIQPPLYYALLAGWGRLAGWGEWSLRFPSLFFGLLVVPLLAALALRWSGSRLAALLAALFATCHPLLLYYSQEARMYTLLVALGVGIAYWVLGIGKRHEGGEDAESSIPTDPHRWSLWGVYVVAATAALYTHYFAAFLLLAVNVAYLLNLPRTSRVMPHVSRTTHYALRNTFPWLLANAAVFLLYFPWLGNLLTRLDVDASYWEGSLKLWEALTAVAIRFTSGETVLEGQATRLLWMYGAVTLLAVIGMGNGEWGMGNGDWRLGIGKSFTHYVLRNTKYTISNIQYPLLLLLVPVAAVLTLASFTPKFNARYVMVALPGLLLIWSAGLAGFLRGLPHPNPPQPGEGTGSASDQTQEYSRSAPPPLWGRLGGGLLTQPHPNPPQPGEGTGSASDQTQEYSRSAPPPLWGRLGGGLLVLLLLAGFIHADRNWFTDTAFTKDQWREVVGYLRGHMDANNPVVLVSGHAWPIWRYYAPDIEAVRLPAIEILDVNAVVDLESSAAILRPALLGAESAWLVNWQEEVIDPGDVAGLQLQRAGSEEPVTAQFWGLRLRRFVNLDARAISNAPPIQQPAQADFGDTVELLGYSIEKEGDLLLFWRLTHPAQPLPDLHLTGETRTAAGLIFSRIGDRRLAAYDFPSFRWQIGQIVAGRIPANEWIGAGAPPGNYQLRLGVYDPAGDWAGFDLLGAQGERLGKRAAVAIALPQPIPLPADEQPTSWHPLVDGLFVRPILVNSSAQAGEPIFLQILWFSETPRSIGQVVIHWNDHNSAAQWGGERVTVALALPAAQPVRTVHQIPVPADLPAGEYWLELSADSQPTRPVELPVTILSASRSFALPALEPALSANFGGQIVLVGLTETELPAQIAPGDVLPLTFVWQSGTPAQTDYTMSVQWLDGDGRPAGQQDERLPRGSSAWLPNEVISQIIKLAAPEQPGEYRLIVAVYDANRSGLPRLRLPNGADFVQVARVRIHPTAQP